MIYHTDQVTKPIKQWTRVKVAIENMPFRLKLDQSIQRQLRLKRNSNDYAPLHDDIHYLRISAVNSQLGEGPYSNIVELKMLSRGKLLYL